MSRDILQHKKKKKNLKPSILTLNYFTYNNHLCTNKAEAAMTRTKYYCCEFGDNQTTHVANKESQG